MTDANASLVPLKTFGYRAVTADGHPLMGSIDAADYDEAQRTLTLMRLRVIDLAVTDRAAKAKPLSGDDFLNFNQQLAYITQAGLPIERGLRLIAQETRSPRVAETIRRIADDAERGMPLGEAFAAQRGNFPPLYGKLIDAGVKTNNLSAMLFNLGRHMELINRLRNTLWRTIAYPFVVLAMLVFVLFFIGLFILPKFVRIFDDFHTKLPDLTRLLMATIPWMPWALAVVVAVVIAVPLIWRAIQLAGADQYVIDALILPLPLVGPILQRNIISRWCDAVRLGVEAGLDLPAAIRLAGEAISAPSLTADGERIIEAITTGASLMEVRRMSVLPDVVTATLDIASRRHDPATSLATLSRMYQQQAEYRLSTMGVWLTPVLLLVLSSMIGFVIAGLFLPLVRLVNSLTGY